eukprot:2218360-Rhodomonas_salina.1
MSREGEESTLYSAALRGLRSMTLGDDNCPRPASSAQQRWCLALRVRQWEKKGFKTRVVLFSGRCRLFRTRGQTRVCPRPWRVSRVCFAARVLRQGLQQSFAGRAKTACICVVGSLGRKEPRPSSKKHPVLAADGETVSFWADETGFKCGQARDFTTPRRPTGKAGNLSGVGRESEGSGMESESELEAEDREVTVSDKNGEVLEGDGDGVSEDVLLVAGGEREEVLGRPEEAEEAEDSFPKAERWTADDWRMLFSAVQDASKIEGSVGKARREVIAQMMEGVNMADEVYTSAVEYLGYNRDEGTINVVISRKLWRLMARVLKG